MAQFGRASHREAATAYPLAFNIEISARFDVIRAGLQLFDAHLFQEPTTLDFLRRHYLKAFD